MGARNRAIAALSTALLAFVASGCVTETRPTQDVEIRFRDPSETYRTVALERVLLDGVRIGTLETRLILDDDFDDANDQHLMFVQDLEGRNVGFVTDDGRAYRYQAHSDNARLVANHDDLPHNVRAVFGYWEGDVTFSSRPDEAPAAPRSEDEQEPATDDPMDAELEDEDPDASSDAEDEES